MKPRQYLLGNPIALMRMAMRSVLVSVLAYTWADSDLWGHVRFGRDIIARGAIPQIDTYAFTSGKPWVNHEWLAEVTMALAYGTGGMLGLVALKVALVAGTMALLFHSIRRSSGPSIAVDILLFITVAGANVRLSAVRPQLYSLLLFAAVLTLLIEVDRGRSRWMLGLPVVMVAWVNLHGGWLVGVGTIGLWGAMRMLWPPEGVGRGRLAAVCGAVLVATLVNPYGVGLWEFLASTVRLARPDIAEWRPIVEFPRLLVPWGMAWLLAAAAIYQSRKSRPWPYVAIVVALGLASFRVSRLDAFFVFSVVMLLAPQIGQLWAGDPGPSPPPDASWQAAFAVSTVAWVAVLGASAATIMNLSCIRMNADRWPEPAAAAFIRQNDLRGRMITWFNWGEYAIWHLAPRIQVSMDGRRETVYTNEQIQGHLDFYFDRLGALSFVRDLAPDFIWLPKELPVVDTLRKAGWVSLYEGSTSVILSDRPVATVARPEARPQARRCFPSL